MLNALVLTLRRARQERLPQVAGSLAFTTVLSVVPLVAVSFSLFTRFPVFARFEAALEQHLLRSLLPDGIARTVLKYLHQFAANAGTLTLAGTAFLLVAAVALLLTVENAFNQMWNVRRNRPLHQRVALYLAVLAVAPPLLGVSLWAMSTVMGASMGLIEALPPTARVALDLLPALLGWVALAWLFHVLPNTKVRRRDAIAGALVATLALELGKRAFARVLLEVPTYRALYGAFAVFPLFLLWIYFSWLVTLAAAMLAANLGRSARS
jgi:membrane protein